MKHIFLAGRTDPSQKMSVFCLPPGHQQSAKPWVYLGTSQPASIVSLVLLLLLLLLIQWWRWWQRRRKERPWLIVVFYLAYCLSIICRYCVCAWFVCFLSCLATQMASKLCSDLIVTGIILITWYKCHTSFWNFRVKCRDFRVLLCLLSSTKMPPSKTFARECRETNCKVLPAWKNQDFTHCPQFLGILRANFVLDILLGIKLGNRHF